MSMLERICRRAAFARAVRRIHEAQSHHATALDRSIYNRSAAALIERAGGLHTV